MILSITRSTAFLTVLLAFSEPASAQGSRNVSTTIESAVVFQNRAQLTNIASTSIEAGVTNLVLTGLPTSLDPQSLYADAKGDALLQGISFQNNYLKPGQRTRQVVMLEDSLEYYRDQIRLENDQSDIMRKEEQMILANQQLSGKDKAADPEDIEAFADFFRNRLTNIRANLALRDRSIKRMTRQTERLQRQLGEMGVGPTSPTGEVVVTLSAEARTSIELRVTYVVYNASWTPRYDIRASETGSSVKLHYKADVVQNTGIDWRRVKLRLSSGNPSSGAQKPELPTWRLDITEPIRNRRQALSKNAQPRIQMDAAPAGLAEEEKKLGFSKEDASTMADFTTVSESAVAVDYTLTVPYTVPSDGKPHMVELQQYDVKALQHHSTVPKLDKDAFLMARVTGWEQYNLVPGPVNTFFGGTFIGESYLDPRSTDDTLNVSLGRDKNVVVQRERTKEYRSKSLLGGKVKETFAYEISIRNTKQEPVTITVEDQIPVSGDGQIEVDVQEISGAKLEKETGKLSWELKINPGDTKKLPLKFDIKYPKGKVIQGL